MKYDFVIFGGTGLQGRICARDIAESGYSTLLIGRDPSGINSLLKKFKSKLGFFPCNLDDYDNIVSTIKRSGAKIVINCAELTYNTLIMKACLETRRSLTDLGGLHDITKKQFLLDKEFKKQGVLCITGCGSTPGISNILVAHVLENMDSVDKITLGFAWDSNIKTFILPYSIKSIFDEFTQAPITFHNSKFIKESRLKCPGTFNFKEIGKQTAYCIVHSEVYTFAKYFKKSGLKSVHYLAGFPKHSMEKIRSLIDLGFNSNNEIKIQGIKVKPLDFTSEVLKKIPIPEGYKETENIWAKITGKKSAKPVSINIDCIVKTIRGWESAGSNVDTGRAISIISQMLYKNQIPGSGVHAPEGIVPHRIFIKELGKRKMLVYINGRKIN